MNKKGAFFHFILLFGILIALAIFLNSTRTGIVTTEIKGEWQLDFLTQNYFPAELAKLETTLIAKEVGSITAIELGKNGGHTTDSTCGKIENNNLWNKPGISCFPNIQLAFQEEVKKQFKNKNINIEEIQFKGTQLIGKIDKKTIETTSGSYTYQDQFIIDINYAFDEYQEITSQAQQLLTQCQNKELETCLNLPANWNIGDCTNPQQITSKIVSFCVKSDSKLAIEHHFALDFN